jgi:preprotein translocase subunit SecY
MVITKNSMKKMFYIVQLTGALMLVIGCVGPFVVGTMIPPLGYTILQLGGIGLCIFGWVAKKIIK